MKKKKRFIWYDVNETDLINYINNKDVPGKYIGMVWTKDKSNTYCIRIYKSRTKNESVFSKTGINHYNLKCVKKISQYKININVSYIAKQILTECKKLRFEEEFK